MARAITGAIVMGAFVLALATTGSAPTWAQPAQALANVKQQIATAKAHAGFARAAATLADFQQHMGHVLNCIEGKGGKDFNPRWGNVCAGQGNGILTDLREVPGSGPLIPLVQQAGASALGGTMSSQLTAAAREVAEGVEAILEMVEDSLP